MKTMQTTVLLAMLLLVCIFQFSYAACPESYAGNIINVIYKQNGLMEVVVDAPYNIGSNLLEDVVLIIGDIKKPKYIASLSLFTKNGRAKLVVEGDTQYINQSTLRFRYFTNERICHKIFLVSLQKPGSEHSFR